LTQSPTPKPVERLEVRLEVPEGYQLILGQSHFIKSVEDIYEALVTSSPGIKFGVAFSEASGKALVRVEGSDDGCRTLATEFALKLAAGHSFIVILREAYPINVLARLRAVDEVVSIFCATSNPVTVVLAEAAGGRGVLGVVDGISPKGVEGEVDRNERSALLRKIGYKR
jgi:uncharacterized protein